MSSLYAVFTRMTYPTGARNTANQLIYQGHIWVGEDAGERGWEGVGGDEAEVNIASGRAGKEIHQVGSDGHRTFA